MAASRTFCHGSSLTSGRHHFGSYSMGDLSEFGDNLFLGSCGVIIPRTNADTESNISLVDCEQHFVECHAHATAKIDGLYGTYGTETSIRTAKPTLYPTIFFDQVGGI